MPLTPSHMHKSDAHKKHRESIKKMKFFRGLSSNFSLQHHSFLRELFNALLTVVVAEINGSEKSMFYGTRSKKTIKIYQAHQKGHKNNSSLLSLFLPFSGKRENFGWNFSEIDHFSKRLTAVGVCGGWSIGCKKLQRHQQHCCWFLDGKLRYKKN